MEGRLFPVKDYYLEEALEWTGFELNQLQVQWVKGAVLRVACDSVRIGRCVPQFPGFPCFKAVSARVRFLAGPARACADPLPPPN